MRIEPKNLEGLPGAVRFHLASDLVADTFEISVAVPDLAGFAGLGLTNLPDAFRVLYVTDADLVFPAAYAAVGGQLSRAMDWDLPLEPIVVVGIGYGRGMAEWIVTRARDFTPPGTPVSEEARQVVGDAAHGHADTFLRFIAEELHPVVQANFPVLDGPAGLFGHSYGGLFSSYALFSRFPLFDRYIIGSPGNIFPDDFVLDLEQRCWDAGQTLNASAYLTCGSLERTSYSEGLRYIAIAYDKLCDRLAGRQYEGFTLSSREYEGESHLSVGIPTLIDGIKLLYPGDPSFAPRFPGS
ncbi:MAG: alpha/beta hydrolase-fold protein [Gammaproteobacteria bacterium]|nr:alpha/beta hydrolase-fold protein [Gammaproteobacteria bacterium]